MKLETRLGIYEFEEALTLLDLSENHFPNMKQWTVMCCCCCKSLYGLSVFSIFFFCFSHISHHSTATSGLSVSLRDGSINLSNAWTRQLSEHAVGNVWYLFLIIPFADYFKHEKENLSRGWLLDMLSLNIFCIPNLESSPQNTTSALRIVYEESTCIVFLSWQI